MLFRSVIERYPKEAWKLIKKLHDENECLRISRSVAPIEKPKRKHLDWDNANYSTCGCGRWSKISNGMCAECHDDEYNVEVEKFYVDKIKSLEKELINLRRFISCF